MSDVTLIAAMLTVRWTFACAWVFFAGAWCGVTLVEWNKGHLERNEGWTCAVLVALSLATAYLILPQDITNTIL